MEIRQPEAVHDFDGVLSGAPVVKAQKFLGQITSIYRNAEHADPDTLMYDVYTIARPENELNWGLTVLYPVLVNAVLLAVFAASLWKPPSVIERLARLRHPDLPPEGVRWVTNVTRVWCGFFVLNGGIALWTAFWQDSVMNFFDSETIRRMRFMSTPSSTARAVT